jgi:branched-chain amino acid transport system ATP-binding protein
MSFLKLQQVCKYFGNLHAVNNLTLEIEKGGITAIIGPNGAGKTTVFNLITGWHRVTTGEILFKEDKITHLPTYEILRRGIGRSFQIINIFKNLSVYENIRMGILANKRKSFNFLRPVESESYRGIKKRSLQLIETVGLIQKINTMASILSHGDQKALEIGIALSTEPELLLLDEPTAGMSLEESRYTTNLIKEISEKKGITILFTEHDLDMVFSIAERIIVLAQGEIICDGDEKCIKDNRRVQEAYMGSEQ